MRLFLLSLVLFLCTGVFAQGTTDSIFYKKNNSVELQDFIKRIRLAAEHNVTSHTQVNNPPSAVQIPAGLYSQPGLLKSLIHESSKNNYKSYKANSNNNKQLSGGCMDTSFRRLLGVYNGTIFPRSVTKTNDGGILVTVEMYDSTQINPFWKSSGLLLKLDANGNVTWLKQFAETNPGTQSIFSFTNAFELSNQDIICTGYFSTNGSSSVYSTVVYRLTSSGNIIWKNNLKTNIGIFNSPSGTFTYTVTLAVDGLNGDVILCGTSNSNLSSGHIETVVRLNSLGQRVWDANFGNHGIDGSYLFGAEGVSGFMKNGQIVLVGLSHGTNNPQKAPAINFLTLDYTNGNLLTKRFFRPQYANAFEEFGKSFTYFYNHCIRLSNGNYLFYGKVFSDFMKITAVKNHFGVIEFDPAFNLVNSYTINSGLSSNYYGNHIYFNSSGKGLLSLFQYDGNYTSPNEYFAAFNNLQFQNQRRVHYENVGLSEPNGFTHLDNNGYAYIHNYYDNSISKSYIEFRKMHNSDTSSQCLGTDTMFLTFLPLHIIEDPAYQYLDANEPNKFVEVPLNFSQSDTLSTNNTNPCRQINYCDTVKMHGTPFICGNSSSIIFTAFKNKECGAIVRWDIDSSGVDSLQIITDTSVRIYFKNINWQGNLYASFPSASCNTPIVDSISVNILRMQSTLNLGPDTVLCPDNTIVLNAKKGFASYQWQDGSTDSIFTVTQPGTYFVRTTNACGGVFFDTVIVSAHPPIPFDLGPDLSKCNNDSLTITAPSGFMSYSWTPAYNINSTSSQTVKVYPSVDTIYKVRAEKIFGCFAYDSVRVKIFTSPKIDLGIDKSFCFGDSLILNAGTGFNNYLWNNGASSQQITVRNAGLYSVLATANNNCMSKDTLVIQNVYANPVVNLNHDSTLCSGTLRVLNAGSFNSYLWNTGSTSQTISINTTGIYSVAVTDNNNCKGSDSVKIITIFPSPSNFLPSDTTVCSYGSVQLAAKAKYVNYLWNTNVIAPTINVTQAGIYWLQVKDINNCSGKDSIKVAQKDCLKGFFIANAFSPNNDSKNDRFKPMLFGKVKFYEFTIFNQWGQIVFKSNEINKGWDGSYKGLQQDTNIFVWTCKYQFENEPVKSEKGTVLLLR